MNPDDLARILDELGRRLGPAGEHVFALAVRQQIIEGVLSVIGAVVFALVAWRLLGGVRRYRAAAWAKWNAHPTDYPSIDGHPNEDISVSLPTLGGYALGAGVAFAGMVCLQDAATKILNPEYAAIRDILGAIK